MKSSEDEATASAPDSGETKRVSATNTTMANDAERQQLHGSPNCSARMAQFEYVNQLRKLYARRRFCELSACVLGFSGVILMLAQNELLMSADSEDQHRRDASVAALKWVISATTALLVVLILVQYATRTGIHKLQNTVPSNANFFTAQYRMILLELLLCGFHIPPGVQGSIPIRQFHSSLSQSGATSCPVAANYDIVQQGDGCYLLYAYPVEALGVLMIVRLYLLARYLRSASSLYSQWVAFVGSLNDINAMRPFFHFKALFKIRPLLLLVPLTLLNTFLTAAVVRILEHPVQAAFANYWKSVWLAAVTMTATGFGDYYPVTYFGRAFMIASAMSGGVLLIALVQSLFFGVLELSPQELKVKHLIDLDCWEQATHDTAANLIQAAWVLHRHAAGTDNARYKCLQMLYTRMRQARRLRATKPEVTLSLEEQIAAMEQSVVSRMRLMEEEEAKVLDRIQHKTRQIAKLKSLLERKASSSLK